MAPPIPLSSPASDARAFEEAMNALLPEMPLLMHGSGDVLPTDVNPDTAALVSELTVQYISRLVDAAVDAHDLLTDGAGGLLPPPALPNKRKPPLPPKPKNTSASQEGVQGDSRKRRRDTIDYWDEPLPEPKIRSKDASQNERSGGSDDDNKTDDAKLVDPDVWVGAAGVDFWESRSRRAHIGSTAAIGTQCFIFPICHDALLYTRVMELQSARRTIAPILMDPTWIDMINEEGDRLEKSKRKRTAPASKDTKEGDDEDGQDEEDADAESEMPPSWPGMDSLLPIHRSSQD